jgi:hypothetical protein
MLLRSREKSTDVPYGVVDTRSSGESDPIDPPRRSGATSVVGKVNILGPAPSCEPPFADSPHPAHKKRGPLAPACPQKGTSFSSS